MDTDSTFLTLGDKSKEDVIKFVERVNREIPEAMELEIENFYKRGVFVEKKTKEEVGARKKYALIDENGKIKIRGFELVRRDWCKLARDTQLDVLNAILKDGSKERAIEAVRERIKNLREGNFKKEDLIIYTQLRKGKYKVTSPEFSAYEKARKKGIKIPIGSIIGYVITKSGKSISEKAEIAQFAKDYDIEYYINHQIIPAVLKILSAFGYSEEDIKYCGRQTSLEDW
jgi:DNA polymerase I